MHTSEFWVMTAAKIASYVPPSPDACLCNIAVLLSLYSSRSQTLARQASQCAGSATVYRTALDPFCSIL